MRVAIVGPPGSGKSTLASRITRCKPAIRWVEVSRDLIEGRYFSEIRSYLDARRSAREYYTRQGAQWGDDWAAQRILRLTRDDEDLIVTGIRGRANVATLSRAGFFIVLLQAPTDVRVQRVASRDEISTDIARQYDSEESAFFGIFASSSDVDFCIDTETASIGECERILVNICITVSRRALPVAAEPACSRCAISRKNRQLFHADSSVCNPCLEYEQSRLRDNNSHVVDEIVSEISRQSSETALVGFSGGKDSTLVLDYLRARNARIAAFTLNTGYYPLTMLSRAKASALECGVEHIEEDVRPHMSSATVECYHKTAEFFEEHEWGDQPEAFWAAYEYSRRIYSVRCDIVAPFPRVCVMCRKGVIRSYYDLAIRYGAKYVILGLNEWVGLSGQSGAARYSGVRKLQPDSMDRPVFVVHLPFLLRSALAANLGRLRELHWRKPFGEEYVETNGNSCLLAKVSEGIFYRNLKFHPDSTRLAREVRVGFLPRAEALTALGTVHVSRWSVRDILRYAKLIG